MIRIIIVLFVILLLIIVSKNMFTKKRESGTKEILKYCKFCKSYVTSSQTCVNKDNKHENLD